MEEKRTEIGALGEFGLIDRLTSEFSFRHKETIMGAGDDAAILEKDENQFYVMSTDMLNESIHFDLSFMPLSHLGYKSVAVNISDVAAMNAVPKQVLISLGLSNRFSVEAVEEIYKGVRAACNQYGVDMVGGDTTSSSSGLILSVTATGTVDKKKIAKRSGAKNGDVICVTGDLGAAYMGLQVLLREKEVFKANPDMQPKLENYEYLVQRQLKPDARTDFIHDINTLGIVPGCMIDISDGLASELFHLSKHSHKKFKIKSENLPIDPKTEETCREFNLDPATVMLNGGEDYELLFTLSEDDFSKLKNHPDITAIGYVEEGEGAPVMLTRAGTEVELQAQGWQHF